MQLENCENFSLPFHPFPLLFTGAFTFFVSLPVMAVATLPDALDPFAVCLVIRLFHFMFSLVCRAFIGEAALSVVVSLDYCAATLLSHLRGIGCVFCSRFLSQRPHAHQVI